MAEFMRCSVRQPEYCKAMVVFEGVVHGWKKVDMPGWGVLCFCPKHQEAAERALEYALQLHERYQAMRVEE